MKVSLCWLPKEDRSFWYSGTVVYNQVACCVIRLYFFAVYLERDL